MGIQASHEPLAANGLAPSRWLRTNCLPGPAKVARTFRAASRQNQQHIVRYPGLDHSFVKVDFPMRSTGQRVSQRAAKENLDHQHARVAKVKKDSRFHDV